MKYTNSKEFPVVQKLQGVWQIPVGIQEVVDDEGIMSYKYVVYKFKTYSSTMEQDAKKQYSIDRYDELLKNGCTIPSLDIKIDCKNNNRDDFVSTLTVITGCNISDETEIVVRDYYNNNHTITVGQYKTLCTEMYTHLVQLRTEYWNEIDNVEVM